MNRTIHTHEITPLNEKLRIIAVGEPGAGGAPLEYTITLPPPKQEVLKNNGGLVTSTGDDSASVTLRFQNGMPDFVGINGLTIEALIAVCMDRLEGFRNGSKPCAENEAAWDHLRGTLDQLASRQSRIRREDASAADLADKQARLRTLNLDPMVPITGGQRAKIEEIIGEPYDAVLGAQAAIEDDKKAPKAPKVKRKR